MKPGTVALCLGIVTIGGFGVYYLSRATRPPATLTAQAPTPAVAGIQALAMLGSKGIDWLISSKAQKAEKEDVAETKVA